jgi:antitoxin component YwqK of YwqJK toxin-antitoxin module
MKWILSILSIALITCSSKVTITESDISQDIFYVADQLKPFTGKCLVVYSDTLLVKNEFTYEQGYLNGEAIAWYKNGKIRRKGSYYEGMLSGKWEFWNEEGRLLMVANYSHDKLDGTPVYP